MEKYYRYSFMDRNKNITVNKKDSYIVSSKNYNKDNRNFSGTVIVDNANRMEVGYQSSNFVCEDFEEVFKIDMSKNYIYEDGSKATILTVDRPNDSGHNVVSMTTSGGVMTHGGFGDSNCNHGLIEFDEFKDLKRVHSEGAILQFTGSHGNTITTEDGKFEFANTIDKYSIKGDISIEEWDKHKDVIKAFWDGKKIEGYASKTSHQWVTVTTPTWRVDKEFRVFDKCNYWKVDKKILIIDGNDKVTKRYFSHYEDGKVYFFGSGQTSWTTDGYIGCSSPKFIKEV